MTDISQLADQPAFGRLRAGLDSKNMFETLTRQQMAVMDRLACGLSNKEIASSLSLSCSTIKTHVLAIYQKTRLPNRIQLALLWLKYRGVIVEAEATRPVREVSESSAGAAAE